MPASSRSTSAHLRYPDFDDLPTVAEYDNVPPRASKKKTKNAVAKQQSTFDHAEDRRQESAPMGQAQPQDSAALDSSIVGQLPVAISRDRKTGVYDTQGDTAASQKVSDEHTPPTDPWARSATYGKGRPVEPIPGFSTGSSPPYEPGFSSRGPYNARSPPISPPVRKSRPVSYGGSIPPLPAHPRASTSPYGYSGTAYGSPPALPHMHQQHFYGAHDIDLGLQPPHAPLQEPHPLKFAHLPAAAHDSREGVLLIADGALHVVSYNGEKAEHVGSLSGVPGTIIDAVFLTWNDGADPFADYRPLVALVVHGQREACPASPSEEDRGYQREANAVSETRVVVFSVSKGCFIAELLRIPSSLGAFPGLSATTAHVTNLKVHASGNWLIVASGDSGEIFVFAPRHNKESAVFECLGKYWTTIQPQSQRRDSSSHGLTSDADVSPADIGRGSESESLPILTLNGRWLALCPPGTTQRRSIGATLGDRVVYNKNSNIDAGTAPSRPLPSCEVESPDADTFLSKVAKGFAQEAVKGAKWISERGMATWQNYWKKDAGSPNLPPAQASSPPVYSPHLAIAQFPPTHADNQQGMRKDPDVVSILDLKQLQESQGRKTSEMQMITFLPPGGCSFLSLLPTGLGLLTANRKGDVQYIWDLMQMKYCRSSITPLVAEGGRVRQVARYERVSPSTIVDLAWDGLGGFRFALLTKNRTIHIFDVPRTAFQWPPPLIKKHRPTSAPVDPAQVKADHDAAPTGGFLASAMSIAGRTQPMLASLRGRAPSISGGIVGLAPPGIGFTSTTTIRSGGRAVAAGFSKSLGAASETVTSIRHANQSRLHLKVPARPGLFCWVRRDGKSVLSILDENNVKNYYVRVTKPRENRQLETVSVFDARKAKAAKLPQAGDLLAHQSLRRPQTDAHEEGEEIQGFWKTKTARENASRTPHPLASAEIETNAPFPPFHSDRRVTVRLTSEGSPMTTNRSSSKPHQSRSGARSLEAGWVFGSDILCHAHDLAFPVSHQEDASLSSCREPNETSTYVPQAAGPSETFDEDVPQASSSTKKKKAKKARTQPRFFEDDDALPVPEPDPTPFGAEDDLLDSNDIF